jgi:hypothetical protein
LLQFNSLSDAHNNLPFLTFQNLGVTEKSPGDGALEAVTLAACWAGLPGSAPGGTNRQRNLVPCSPSTRSAINFVMHGIVEGRRDPSMARP